MVYDIHNGMRSFGCIAIILFSLNVKHILLSFDKRKLHPLLSFSVAKTLPDVIKSKFKSRWPTRTNCDEHKEALVVYWLVSI